MATVNFPKDRMLEILEDRKAIVSDRMIEHKRWSIVHEIVFRADDRLWCTRYNSPATESQDEGPWEYMDDVPCIEVEPVQEMVTVYHSVKE